MNSAAHRICVYCGSKPGNSPRYRDMARNLADAMTRHGLGLVYGGSNIGLMGETANRIIANGGEAIGVIPDNLFDDEIAHNELSELITTASMHERKHTMAELSDAFVALPGGYGTLEEVFEAITWLQLKIHDKPIGLLNVDGFYDGLHQFLDHACAEGFIRTNHRDLYILDDDPDSLIDRLQERITG